jgi:hypothetical protein
MATSYANTGGTGDRTAIISISNSTGCFVGTPQLVNGNLTETSWYFTSGAASGKWIQFDFGDGVAMIIDEIKWYQSGSETHGTWKMQGSNDGATWSDLGSPFTLGGATPSSTHAFTNTAGYRFYKLQGVSGDATNWPWLYEIEFKIEEGEPPAGPDEDASTSTGGMRWALFGGPFVVIEAATGIGTRGANLPLFGGPVMAYGQDSDGEGGEPPAGTVPGLFFANG